MISTFLKFKGANFLRQRIVFSLLSGKSIKIESIRPEEEHIGLKEYEITFLKLIEEITNGTTIEINYTGTSILFKPGAIVGGRIDFDCGLLRSISYFLEPLIALAPFSKNPFTLKLSGVTNDTQDLCIDTLRTVTLPQLHRFGLQDGLELKVKKRGAMPDGGGEIFFHCPIVKQLKPIQLIEEGRIQKIRGISYATRVSPQNANRMVESSRSLLNHFIPDVFIYTDVFKGQESGKSPGFGLSLVAETTKGILLSAEQMAKAGQTPEDVGLEAARKLYHQIQLGGTVDVHHQWLMLHFMALGPEDVSRIRLSHLSDFTIQYLRDLKEFFGTVFKIEAEKSSVLLTCVGVGYVNLNKKVS